MAKSSLTKHHRVPRSRGGSSEPKNISFVPDNMHSHYHALFENKLPVEVASVLSETWIDPDYVLVAIRKEDVKTVEKILYGNSKY